MYWVALLEFFVHLVHQQNVGHFSVSVSDPANDQPRLSEAHNTRFDRRLQHGLVLEQLDCQVGLLLPNGLELPLTSIWAPRN